MKLKSSLLAGLFVTATSANMVVPCATASSQSVNIGYTSANILDPTNPNSPDWGVSIPVSFDFTESNLNQNMNVTLNNLSADPSGLNDVTVEVFVSSTNGFKLKNNNENEFDYTLKYQAFDSTYENIAGQTYSIGTLSADKTTLIGTASFKLPNDNTINGRYMDKLTYTIISGKDSL